MAAVGRQPQQAHDGQSVLSAHPGARPSQSDAATGAFDRPLVATPGLEGSDRPSPEGHPPCPYAALFNHSQDFLEEVLSPEKYFT